MLGHEDVREAEEEGSWKGKAFILTYTGKVFSYDEIVPDMIDIRDIAHSLSQICRYTGHTRLFYSVAQHSLLVSEKLPGGPAEKLVGLLHDAAEAYTNDLASPLKRWLDKADGSGISWYGILQNAITAVVYRKFGVTNISANVRLYDGAASVFEAEGFLGLCAEALEKYEFPMHLRNLWQPWEPLLFSGRNSDREMGQVETEFLERFETLMDELGRTHD